MDTTNDSPDIPPAKLFYYADENVISGLWEEELKLSNPLELNDPFEFLPKEPEPEDQLIESHRFKELAAESWHLLSLSHSENNVRMWSQYGGRHKGIMLTLDLLHDPLASLKDPGGAFLKVDYQKPEFNFRVVVYSKGSIEPENLKRLAITKGANWSHEEEWRLLVNAAQCVSGSDPLADNQFARFRMFNGRLTAFLHLPPRCIHKITVGCLADKNLISTIESIQRKKDANWIIAQARPSHDKFAFTEEIIYSPPSPK